MVEQPKIKPGDRLFWSRNLDRLEPGTVVIETVGRKWATFNNGWTSVRVNVETLQLAGPRGFGRLFRSEEDWQRERDARQAKNATEAAWNTLLDLMRKNYRPPAWLTAAAINGVINTLFTDPKT